MFQGAKTRLLANADGHIEQAHCVSSGPECAAAGPKHALLQDIDRVEYTQATDAQFMAAFKELCHCEASSTPSKAPAR